MVMMSTNEAPQPKALVRYEPALHKNVSVIFIRFEYDRSLNARIRKLVGVQWSHTEKAWYVPNNAHYRRLFGLAAPLAGKAVIAQIHTANQGAFGRLIETLQLKAYSKSTLKTYRNEFAQLLYVLKKQPVDELTPDRLRGYFLYCINTLKLSENTLHSRINAVKFYFEQVLHRQQVFFEIPRPQKPSILPKVISPDDIKQLFAVTTNLKHNTMLKLCYGMGLRVSEMIALKITDIDSKAMQVFIERAKGKKDRYANLPESILDQLRAYFLEYRPKKFLFEGQYGDQYSSRSAQKVFKDALRKAKINKDVGGYTVYAIVLLRIYWRAAQTSGSYRNYWATMTSRRRCVTRK